MPTYEYECRACGHQFEAFQRMSDPPLKKCPSCKKSTARRAISGGAGFLFKGSGFYTTDYRSESYRKAAKAEQGAASSAPADNKAKPAKKDGASSTGASAK
jgi:putative FmdB family regulatory protein